MSDKPLMIVYLVRAIRFFLISALISLDIQLKMATADFASIMTSNNSHESLHSTYSNRKPSVDAQATAALHTTVPVLDSLDRYSTKHD